MESLNDYIRKAGLSVILCDVYSCVWNTGEGECENTCLVISDKWSDGPRCLEVEVKDEDD